MAAAEPQCIPDVLRMWTARTPDAPAIATLGREALTFGHLERQMYAVVQQLGDLGLGAPHRIATVLPNGPEMAVAALGIASGASCVPLNPAYGEREFDFYFAALRPTALITQLGIDTPAREIARTRGMRVLELAPTPHAAAGLFTLGEEAESERSPPALAAPADPALVLHTSGTTSRPKIVSLTHAHICQAAAHLSADLSLGPDDRCLNLVPLFHTYGLVAAILTSLIAGGCIMCLDGFEADPFFTALDAFQPTWYQGVPAMHQAILSHAATQPDAVATGSLRFIRTGSAPTHDRVRAGLERTFQAAVIEGYGMVEAAGPVTCNPPSWGPYKPGSIGASVGPEVAILDDVGRRLPAGVHGEIAVRGASVIQGYENDAAANREAFADGGWFRSGDAGYMDADGYVFLTGRLKEMINRGGEKIVPQEVDNVLLEHPDVVQAAAFAVPHTQLGEDVAAAVVLSPQTTATSHELRHFAAARLAAYKVPQQIYIVSSIPSAATGLKPQRRGLAEALGLTPQAESPLPSSSPLAGLLTEIWQDILQAPSIGPHDNFFALGGHSLPAVQVLSRLREAAGVDLAPRVLFDRPTIAELAAYLEAESPEALPGAPRLLPRPLAHDQVSATLTQEQLWRFDQIFPNAPFFTIPYVLHLDGPLDHQALTRSFGHIIERHEALRTTFGTVAGQVVQTVQPASAFELPVEDVSAFSPSVQDAQIEQRIEDDVRRPFDLGQAPLLRACLIRCQPHDHVLIITLHHIMSDGWSLGVLARELAAVYDAFAAGAASPLAPMPIQFADYVHWQQQWRESLMQAVQLNYWTQQLDGPLDALPLLTDRPRQSTLSFSTARQTFEIAAPLSQALTQFGLESGCSSFMLLLTALKVWLRRETGCTDIRVGTIVANRQPAETEGLIGLFTNTLILRTQLDGNPMYREALRRVRETTLAAYAHQTLPFEAICQALESSRQLQPARLCQVMLILQPAELRPAELPCQTLKIREIDPSLTESRFPPTVADLVLMLRERDVGLTGSCIYKTSLYNSDTIIRFIQNFQDTLTDILTNSHGHIDV